MTSTESAHPTGPSAYREAVELEFVAATKRYPGADAPEVVARAKELGLNVVTACSIVDVGVNPHTLPEE